jgi:hypothetical protein
MYNNIDEIIAHVNTAINNTESYNSKLTEQILRIEGMSGRKNRHLLNNIICDESRYLEIGLYCGSTFISALYKNSPEIAIGIDNWSYPGLQKQITLDNLCRYLPSPAQYEIIDKDCFAVDLNNSNIKNINTYFYDGHHFEHEQIQALEYYYSVLSDMFIYIVDDYADIPVQIGTKKAIQNLNLIIEYENIKKHSCDQDHYGWWNGLGIYILRKN